MNRRVFFLCAALLASPATAPAQNVDVKVHTLENGLKVLMVPRRGDPNITAGWIAKVGSVNERPGITGIAHLFEHMMFKGTRTIGTSDIDKDLQTLARLDAIKGEMQKEEEALARRLRVGEISDTRDPKVRSANHQELRKKFEELLKTQKANIVKDEFDKIYKGNGASGMNAGTSYDFTIYFVNVPANKLELWFWMESDRLLNPVFREFYSERDVVREERRLRVESTPTGKFEEQFDALFWGSSPYSWPVIGWPSDVEGITREEAMSFYGVYYAPNNLTACLVGDFEPEQARKLAEKYFGRLKRGPRPPPAVRTIEIKQLAEKKMTGYAETKPQVRLRYHSVADGHVDEPALVVLQDILNGRTGRFYKSLVLDRKIATSAGGGQEGRKYEGYFEVSATAAEGHTPKEVQGALETILDELKEKDVGSRELQKVKNQRAASEFRKLRSNFSLMLQLLLRDSYRGWKTINTDPALLQAVTASDIKRVAAKYFTRENRAVLVFHTKEKPTPEKGAAPEKVDPDLAGLAPEERQKATLLKNNLPAMDRATTEELRENISTGLLNAPKESQAFLKALLKIIDRHLEGKE